MRKKAKKKATCIDSVLLLESPLSRHHLGLASARRQTDVLEPLLKSLGYRVYSDRFHGDVDLALLLKRAADKKLGIDVVHISAHGDAESLRPSGMNYLPLSEDHLRAEGFKVSPFRKENVLVERKGYRCVVAPLLNILAGPNGRPPLEGKILVMSACSFVNDKTGPEIKKASRARAVVGYSKTAFDSYCNILEPMFYFFLFGKERAQVGKYVATVNQAMERLGLPAALELF